MWRFLFTLTIQAFTEHTHKKYIYKKEAVFLFMYSCISYIKLIFGIHMNFKHDMVLPTFFSSTCFNVYLEFTSGKIMICLFWGCSFSISARLSQVTVYTHFNPAEWFCILLLVCCSSRMQCRHSSGEEF